MFFVTTQAGFFENSNSFGWLSRVNPFCPKGKMDGLL
jgi:hypothetical protein